MHFKFSAEEAISTDKLKTLSPDRVLPFIWHFVAPMKWQFLLAGLFYTAGQMAFMLEPVFFGQIVGRLVDGAAQDQAQWHTIATLAVTYLVLVQVIGRIFFTAGWWVEALSLPVLTARARAELAAFLRGHSYRYFQDDFAGRLSGKVMEMPQAITMTVLDLMTAFLFTFISLIFTYFTLLYLHWVYSIITTVYIVVFYYSIFVASPRLQVMSQAIAHSRNKMRGHFIDSISNILLAKSFARDQFEQTRLHHDLVDVTSQDQNEQKGFWRLGTLQHFNNAWLQIMTVIVSIYGWSQGWLPSTTVATALPLVAVMAGNSWWLLHVSGYFFIRLGEIREGMSDLLKPQDVSDVAGAPNLMVREGTIEFRDVTFTYPGRPVFEKFTLTIPPRQKVGLVGPSGAGKSTFMQILLRLHDIQSGDIRIDGQNIHDVTQGSLRENIAFIPQSSDLLHRTILENINYGRLDATRAEIEQAAAVAHAQDFIPHLTDKDGNTGYDALVGERGVKLSGGQRQRISIARAVLKNAPILLLDEATSALDSESEALIQQALFKMMEGRTVIAIAHRLSTIAHMDRLLVMVDGRIIEDGSHQDLLSRNGYYASLWARQAGGFLTA